MPLTTTLPWTSHYYSIVEHYFWEPGLIGRKSHGETHPWDYWKESLERQETPLNQMLNLLFCLAPRQVVDDCIGALVGGSLSGTGLVEVGLNHSIVQPDLVFKSGRRVTFVEMKVDSKSSIDQFVKYAIAAQLIQAEGANIESFHLVMLSRSTLHEKLWQGHRFHATQELRDLAVQGLRHDSGVWRQSAVPTYLAGHPDRIDDLERIISSMGVTLRDYSTLRASLEVARSFDDSTLGRLIDGVLCEFDKRGL